MSDFTLSDNLWETEKQVRLFHANLKIYIIQDDKSSPTQRQLDIYHSLDKLSKELQQDIATYALDYCKRIDSLVNLAAEGRAIKPNDLAKHYAIKSILIPEIGNCDTNYLFISADCDWEEEHGMQFIVADGRVISCGDHSTLPFSALWKNVIAAPSKIRTRILNEYLKRIQ